MNGAIADLSRNRAGADAARAVDIAIVGSGCGGATAAWQLAQAGREVLVIEEGGDYTGLDLTQRDGAMYDQLYMDRGGRMTTDMSIAVLQGRALGGGGVINACDVVPMADGVLRHWQRRYGLTDYSPERLAPYRTRALADLSVNPPRADQINRNNSLLRAGAEALGWRGEIMMHNRVGCAGTGTCLIGCPLNAKRNPRFVAIPGALAAGARFWLRGRVVRVDGATQELKTLTVRTLDSKGYHETGELSVRARAVILAANAIASAELLLKSGIGNEHVGRHLMLQPQLPITALFADEVRFFRGIPQAYAVTEFEELDEDDRGLWGFRIEAIAGTPGIASTMLPKGGLEGKALMAHYPYMTAALLLVPDGPHGQVRVEQSGRLRIDYAMPPEQKLRFRAAARAAARAYLAAGAEMVVVSSAEPIVVQREADLQRLDHIAFTPATLPLMSAHQQGSVRFAASPKFGGATPDGLVYGTRDVFVFDSSGFPTSSSSHTMTPIITVSRYLADRLLARAS